MSNRINLGLALLTSIGVGACSSATFTSGGKQTVTTSSNRSHSIDTSEAALGTESAVSTVQINSGRTLAIVSTDLTVATAAVSSNPAVATYTRANSTLTGVSPGDATIAITKADGMASEIKVKVTAPMTDLGNGRSPALPVPADVQGPSEVPIPAPETATAGAVPEASHNPTAPTPIPADDGSSIPEPTPAESPNIPTPDASTPDNQPTATSPASETPSSIPAEDPAPTAEVAATEPASEVVATPPVPEAVASSPAPITAQELASAETSGIIKSDFKSGFEQRIVVCQAKHIQTYSGGSQAWGCKATCNDDEALFSGGANFAAAKILGWSSEPLDSKTFYCSANISACSGGLDLSKTGCNTTCFAACFKRTDKLIEKDLSTSKVWVPAPIQTRQVSCNTTKIGASATSQTWGCKATCNSGETAVAGGGKYAQAYTKGMTLVPEDNGYSCSVNISSCSGGLDLSKTGCNSTCTATCAKAAEPPPAPEFKRRVVTCNASKQTVYPGGAETWGCVAQCDAATEVVASGGWSFGDSETNGILGHPTVDAGFACAANISKCNNGLNLSATGCHSGCSATCLQVAGP